jgi:hypothetical protein
VSCIADREARTEARDSSVSLESLERNIEVMSTILLIILILLLIGALPRWPYSSGWGYYPSGALTLILIILIVLLLMGYI